MINLPLINRALDIYDNYRKVGFVLSDFGQSWVDIQYTELKYKTIGIVEHDRALNDRLMRSGKTL